MMSPFDWRSVLLARHAQHVVLIHFPIALFIIGVWFDLISAWRKRQELARAAYYNFTAAAILSVPAAATGIIAWQWALEGQRLKGTLLLHLVFALASVAVIWIVWFLKFRACNALTSAGPALPVARLTLELAGVALLSLTGHLGGFLSGVNSGM
jgi:uncharacterized membrane protein